MSDSPSLPQPPAKTTPRQRRVFLAEGILFFGVAGILVLAAMQVDLPVNRWVVMHGSPMVKDVAQFLSKSGEGQWPIGVGLLVTLIGWRSGRQHWRRAGLALVLATTVAGLVAISVRATTGRARPSNPIEQGWFGPYHDGQWTAFRHAYSSFPSGHAATAAGFAVTLTCAVRGWGWVALFWMTGVGWSRICLQSHNFSDVIAGFICGLGTALLVWHFVDWPSPAAPPALPQNGAAPTDSR